jgi:hypothetical protein
VLLEKVALNSGGKTSDRLVLGFKHLGEVEFDSRDCAHENLTKSALRLIVAPKPCKTRTINSSVGQVVLCLVVDVRVVQHRLGGDASDVETGTAESTSLLDTDGLETELGSLDGSDVSTRS